MENIKVSIAAHGQANIVYQLLTCKAIKKTAVWSFVFTPYSSFTVLSTI